MGSDSDHATLLHTRANISDSSATSSDATILSNINGAYYENYTIGIVASPTNPKSFDENEMI